MKFVNNVKIEIGTSVILEGKSLSKLITTSLRRTIGIENDIYILIHHGINCLYKGKIKGYNISASTNVVTVSNFISNNSIISDRYNRYSTGKFFIWCSLYYMLDNKGILI